MSRRQVNGRSKGHIKRPSTSTDDTMNVVKRSIPNDFYRDFASQKISDDAEESPSTDVSTTEDSEEDEAVLYEQSVADPSTAQCTKCKCGADESIRKEIVDMHNVFQTDMRELAKRQNELYKSLILEMKMVKDSMIEEVKNVRDNIATLLDFSTHRILFNQTNGNNGADQEDLFVANNVTNDEGYFHR